jgi:hypothetical protein
MRKWNETELNYLIANYSNNTNKDLSNHLGRTDRAVGLKAVELGLKKTSEHRSKMSKITYKPNNKGLFKKGVEAWNKGKKGYMGSNKTSFKKGHRPKTALPLGAIRVTKDGLMIKTAEPNVWEYAHRVLYSKYISDLSKTDIVKFKDGNNLNLSLDNLEKVDRGNHLRDNGGRERLKPELSKLNMAINKVQKLIKDGTKK